MPLEALQVRLPGSSRIADLRMRRLDSRPHGVLLLPSFRLATSKRLVVVLSSGAIVGASGPAPVALHADLAGQVVPPVPALLVLPELQTPAGRQQRAQPGRLVVFAGALRAACEQEWERRMVATDETAHLKWTCRLQTHGSTSLPPFLASSGAQQIGQQPATFAAAGS